MSTKQPKPEQQPKQQPEPPASSNSLPLRTGVRAGSVSKLGNKVWSDDWLAPV